jgi:tRNA dimethylallyltransferase
VPHHCLDLVSPADTFSVAHWLAQAASSIEAIRRRGRRILLVGGTPLFLRALRDGLAPLPGNDPELRRRLAEEAARGGLDALHARLAAADPPAAARIHRHDARRIIRALEVIQATGRSLSDSWRDSSPPDGGNASSAAFVSQMLVVDLPRRLLSRRIDDRVDAMFANGLVDETRAALASCGIGPTAGQAAGYAEAAAVLAGTLSLDDAIARTKTRTRQLAKRQLTWLRSFTHAIWITA